MAEVVSRDEVHTALHVARMRAKAAWEELWILNGRVVQGNVAVDEEQIEELRRIMTNARKLPEDLDKLMGKVIGTAAYVMSGDEQVVEDDTPQVAPAKAPFADRAAQAGIELSEVSGDASD